MTWAIPTIYYDNHLTRTGATLTATSTKTGTDVANLGRMLEINRWELVDTTSPAYVTVDLGTGTTADADYLLIYGHNLGSLGATVTLQHSATGTWTGEEVDAFTGVTLSVDTVFLKEFTAMGAKQHTRLKIAAGGGAFAVAPKMAICLWGLKTELARVTASFDPHSLERIAEYGITGHGIITGVESRYMERQLRLTMNDVDSTVYDRVKAWQDASGPDQVFVAWDKNGHPGDVWLMYPEGAVNNPIRPGSFRRDITLNFRGRVET